MYIIFNLLYLYYFLLNTYFIIIFIEYLFFLYKYFLYIYYNNTMNTLKNLNINNMNIKNIKKPNLNIEDITNRVKNLLKSGNQTIITYFLIGTIIILLFGIIYYIRVQMSKKVNQSEYMKSNLEEIPINITNININDAKFKYKLRDYYIMSSYNSCCNGQFNNSFVDYEPLKMVIKRGARLLDFEVYSVDNKTVIAVSYNNNYYQKGSYNSLPFSKVMDLINDYAFSASTCPNFNDPLFLHFRIKSSQPHVFKDMLKILTQVFSRRRLSNKYNYEFNGNNIGAEPLQEFLGKVIIMCDRSNSMYSKTGLDEIINVTSGSHFLKGFRNYDVQFVSNYKELVNSNKKNMAISFTDLSKSNDNINVSLHMKYGIQMPCMNFQNLDANLNFYLNNFNKNGHAFILKPVELRYVEKTIPLPKPQNKELSFAEKKIKKPYFSHKI